MGIRNFALILSILLLSLEFCIDVNAATQGYIPRDVNIDRSDLPKNILVASFIGGRSHLKPMLDITSILVEKGYNIVLATSGNYTPSSEYPTLKQISLGPELKIKDMKSPLVHSKFDFKRFSTIMEMTIRIFESLYGKYMKIAKDYDINLFICDNIANDACIDVGHMLNKPVIGFTSDLSGLISSSYKSDPMFHCSISLENESFLERFKCSILQRIRWSHLLSSANDRLNVLRKQLNVDTAPTIFHDRLRSSTLVLLNAFFGFDLPQSLPPNIREIGPVLSDEYPPITPELSDFMNKHNRVLYVAFGTRAFTTPENHLKLLQSFTKAIDKNLFDGVIWSLGAAIKDEILSTLSSEEQALSILNNENPHILITMFVPQFALLNHTNTKLFLTHGGALSSHESLYNGVPMLILPFFADQMGNADKLKSAGVALTLNKLHLNIDDIVSKMDFLLKDENVKKNLKRMEVLTKINSNRKYGAADLIEYVLHNSYINGGANEEFLKEFFPADTRMGLIRGNNYDILGALLSIFLGLVGGILWIVLKLIKFIVKKPFTSLKSKAE